MTWSYAAGVEGESNSRTPQEQGALATRILNTALLPIP
jgi:hypothetical protein